MQNVQYLRGSDLLGASQLETVFYNIIASSLKDGTSF